jgi:hypothetical protein
MITKGTYSHGGAGNVANGGFCGAFSIDGTYTQYNEIPDITKPHANTGEGSIGTKN